MKLSKTELDALQDCALSAPGNYLWKPVAMRKLADKGLTVEVENISGFAGKAYALTEAGHEALQANRDVKF